jgi:hypothetical protein
VGPSETHHRRRSLRLGVVVRHLTALGVGVLTMLCACRSAHSPPPDTTLSAAHCGDEAVLRVRNFSGHVVEVYASRPAQATRELVSLASPGDSDIPVPGPADIAVTYEVRDPPSGQTLAVVNWRRQTSPGARNPVALELGCRRKS